MRRMPNDPIEDFFQMRDRLYRLLDESFAVEQAARPPSFSPPVDIVAGEEHLLILVEVPGMTDDEVAVEVSDGVVTISGERTSDGDGEFLARERPTGEFSRSFSLAYELDPESVSARLDSGVLEVKVLRRDQTTQIAVDGASEA